MRFYKGFLSLLLQQYFKEFTAQTIAFDDFYRDALNFDVMFLCKIFKVKLSISLHI